MKSTIVVDKTGDDIDIVMGDRVMFTISPPSDDDAHEIYITLPAGNILSVIDDKERKSISTGGLFEII